MAVACECGNEASGSIKCGEFLDKLRTCWLLRMDNAACSYFILKSSGKLTKKLPFL